MISWVGVWLLTFALLTSAVRIEPTSKAAEALVGIGSALLWLEGFICLALGILKHLRSRRIARIILPGR